MLCLENHHFWRNNRKPDHRQYVKVKIYLFNYLFDHLTVTAVRTISYSLLLLHFYDEYKKQVKQMLCDR